MEVLGLVDTITWRQATPLPRKYPGKSRNPEYFMRLQAETPFGMVQAVCQGGPGRPFAIRSVHGLEKEMTKAEVAELFGICSSLGENQLELIPGPLHQWSARFRTYANPIDSLGSHLGSIGLDRNLKPGGVKGRD